jgi:hypothetical protein
VPLFVSDTNLRRMRRLPQAHGGWALDSGGFTQLSRYGTWETGPTPRQYVEHIRRYHEEIGHLEWAAPQDWMCEDVILRGGPMPGGQHAPGTHLTVHEHLRRTVDNFLELRAMDCPVPIVPVLQGDRPATYEQCADLYTQAGVDLSAEPVVGVDSVCRIQATGLASEIIHTVTEITGPGRPHGFGFKIEGLRRVGHLLGSADSMAWSAQGRRTPAVNCDFRLPRSHRPHIHEANCLRYALAWRQRVLAACATQQLTLGAAS